jgi:hypothetical protein
MIRRQPGDLPISYRATAGYHVMLALWIAGGRPELVSADLGYDSAEPYAIRLSLHACDHRTVDWLFARDLLEAGVRGRAGLGDVAAEPIFACNDKFVRITLRTNGGVFYAQLPSRAVSSFLRRTHAIVRPGTEHRHLELDRLIHRLTAETD